MTPVAGRRCLVEHDYQVTVHSDKTGICIANFGEQEREEAETLARRLASALAYPYTVRLHIIFSGEPPTK